MDETTRHDLQSIRDERQRGNAGMTASLAEDLRAVLSQNGKTHTVEFAETTRHLAWAYNASGHYAQAFELFDTLVAHRVSLKSLDPTELLYVQILGDYATALVAHGDVSKAVRCAKIALEIAASRNDQYIAGVACHAAVDVAAISYGTGN